MSDALTIFTDLFGQLGKLPVAALLALVLLAVGLILKKVRLFPNRFIPLVTLIGGGVGYALLGDRSQISPAQPYPVVILGFYGILLGFVTWAAHRWLLKKLERFLPDGFFDPGEFETDPPFPKPDGSNTKP